MEYLKILCITASLLLGIGVTNAQIEMVFVKGGIFNMGCTNKQVGNCLDSEKPAHKV